jgi:hypothetical protein
MRATVILGVAGEVGALLSGEKSMSNSDADGACEGVVTLYNSV